MSNSNQSSFQSFKLAEILGKGGCGTVYRATLTQDLRELQAGSPIAVKIVHPELLESNIVLGRLRREVEIGMRVRSPNVVAIYGVEKCKMYSRLTLAILMDLIEGVTLKEKYSRTSLGEGALLMIAHEAASGLDAIHSLGIVHRDIKPANLMLTAKRRVVITDLGIARLPDISARVTATGSFIGTCGYASPEQFANTEILDPRSDLYSLGVVLYELGTGINPFKSDNLIKTIQAHMREIVAPPSTRNPTLSSDFDNLVMSLLEKKREDRPESAKKLMKIVEGFWTSDEQTQAIPPITFD
ncbi:serine/threonine protein kinase [bacterium]|nr:serine/threonine protein kinase [candidate division CSSED10-310 bacterium]